MFPRTRLHKRGSHHREYVIVFFFSSFCNMHSVPSQKLCGPSKVYVLLESILSVFKLFQVKYLSF